MKILTLTNSQIPVLVDDEDFEDLNQFNWRLLAGKGYVVRSIWENKTSKLEYLHRRITGAPKGFDVDHIDMNPFNNQKVNLRVVTRSQNMANTKPRKGRSQYKGVSSYTRNNMKKPWVAYIKHNYKNLSLGYYRTEGEAAKAYNNKAIELYGDSAQLNIILKEKRDEED